MGRKEETGTGKGEIREKSMWEKKKKKRGGSCGEKKQNADTAKPERRSTREFSREKLNLCRCSEEGNKELFPWARFRNKSCNARVTTRAAGSVFGLRVSGTPL